MVVEERSLSEQAYDKIRHGIVHGSLCPGAKLKIAAISERYAIGSVPVREALNRLSSEGLVYRKSNRGFFVQTISVADLAEVVKTRIWLETKAMTEAIENGDDLWEDELVVSLHRLVRTQRQLSSSPGIEGEEMEQWKRKHKEFHMLLLSGCGSRRLLDFCSTLMDQAMRYSSVSMNTNPNKLRWEGASMEHQLILDAVLGRDVTKACGLLEEHYTTTFERLRQAIGT